MKPQCGPRCLGPRHIHFAPQHSEGVPVSSEMEAAAVPQSVWSNDTWHITLQRKELEPLQMKVRMLYLHWMFLAFLFSMYQARGEGAGTPLFCSIRFKHTISGKGRQGPVNLLTRRFLPLKPASINKSLHCSTHEHLYQRLQRRNKCQNKFKVDIIAVCNQL